MGLLSDRQAWGGGHYAPPNFSHELYNIWSFGGYIHVYTHKPLHGNFQISPITPLRRYDVIFGQNDVISAKIGSINKGP